MDLTVSVLSHLGTFALGVVTWLPFTLWEGHHIKNQEGSAVSEKEVVSGNQRPQRFRFGRTVAIIVILSSLFVVVLGFQQIQFQNRVKETAQCYQDWGQDVTEALDKRSTASTKQSAAERTRSDSIANILLLFVQFQKVKPPLTEAQREEQFNEKLHEFAKANSALDAEDANVKQTKKDFTYPTLDC